MDHSTSFKYGTLFAGSMLCAIESAEASKVTLRNKVRVDQYEPESSTINVPQFGIDYGYNITGVELGLRSSLGIVHSVKGSCYTEYSWLNRTGGEFDFHHSWNGIDSFFFPSECSPSAAGDLRHITFLQPGSMDVV